ncbi:MAG: hypothetical protein J7L11_00755 [Thermoprotei archaeon]|nr:hypothetical protein [Thermoprotei archaeon]
MKRVMHDDYQRYISRMWKLIKEIRERARRPMCASCGLLSESLFTCLSAIKNMEYIAKKEGYEDLIEDLRALRKEAYATAAKVLTKFLMRLD